MGDLWERIKQLNEGYCNIISAHQCRDSILKQITEIVRRELAEESRFVRHGGVKGVSGELFSKVDQQEDILLVEYFGYKYEGCYYSDRHTRFTLPEGRSIEDFRRDLWKAHGNYRLNLLLFAPTPTLISFAAIGAIGGSFLDMPNSYFYKIAGGVIGGIIGIATAFTLLCSKYSVLPSTEEFDKKYKHTRGTPALEFFSYEKH